MMTHEERVKRANVLVRQRVELEDQRLEVVREIAEVNMTIAILGEVPRFRSGKKRLDISKAKYKDLYKKHDDIVESIVAVTVEAAELLKLLKQDALPTSRCSESA